MKRSEVASALGKLARGRPKNYTAQELQARRDRLAVVRSRRWPKKHSQGGKL